MSPPRFSGPTHPCPRCGEVVGGFKGFRAEHLAQLLVRRLPIQLAFEPRERSAAPGAHPSRGHAPAVIRFLFDRHSVVRVAGCATALPTRTVDGIAVYERSADDVARYCYGKVRPEERNRPHIYGCYIASDRIIMVEANHHEVAAHELRQAQGWDHRGRATRAA